MKQNARLALLILGAAATGWLFDAVRLPVAWLLGPMMAGIVAAGVNGKPQAMHPAWQMVGQAILGLNTGLSFPLATLKTASVYAVPLFLAVVATAGLSLLNGHLLYRWAGVDQATGFMGSLPGAASSMVAMSDEMGADAVVVAMLQYIRLLLVSFITPVAVAAIFHTGGGDGAVAQAAAMLRQASLPLDLAVLAACGVLGAWLGKLGKIPSPTFLGPFFAMLIVSWLVPVQFTLPTALFRAGMLAVGISIGVRFDVPLARRLGRVAVIETLLVIGLIAVALGIGYGFHAVTGVDTMTAVLGSTPGGMDTMVASAFTLGANSGLVLSMQLTRWFVVLLAGPWVAGRLVGKDYPARRDLS